MSYKSCLFVASVLLAMGFLATSSASGDLLTINNASFETPALGDNGWAAAPVSGWTISADAGTPTVGVWNPKDTQFTGAGDNGTPVGADGPNILYVSSTVASTVNVTQVLTDKLQAGAYTITAAMGKGLPFTAANNNYAVLTAGSTDLAAAWGSVAALNTASGEFRDYSAVYKVENDNPNLGQTLSVSLRMLNYSGSKITCFDNVRVDFVPVPEPGVITLLGTGLFGLLAYAWRKRR